MKIKVLLVDDDVSVLAALGGALRSEGYDVIQAFDGAEAIQNFCDVSGADIILLDLTMPVMDGWDVFHRLTAMNPLLPVIVITARPDQYRFAVAAGVAALMEKPLDLPLLLETMRVLLAEPPEARLGRLKGESPYTIPLEMLRRSLSLQQVSNPHP